MLTCNQHLAASSVGKINVTFATTTSRSSTFLADTVATQESIVALIVGASIATHAAGGFMTMSIAIITIIRIAETIKKAN